MSVMEAEAEEGRRKEEKMTVLRRKGLWGAEIRKGGGGGGQLMVQRFAGAFNYSQETPAFL